MKCDLYNLRSFERKLVYKSMLVFRYIDMQVCKNLSMQDLMYVSMQVHKNATMQLSMCRLFVLVV